MPNAYVPLFRNTDGLDTPTCQNTARRRKIASFSLPYSGIIKFELSEDSSHGRRYEGKSTARMADASYYLCHRYLCEMLCVVRNAVPTS